MATLSRIRRREVLIPLWLMSLSVLLITGCQSAPSARSASVQTVEAGRGQSIASRNDLGELSHEVIRQTAFDSNETTADQGGNEATADDAESDPLSFPAELDSPRPESTVNELPTLEALAQSTNPKLIRLQQEANAASAKTRYVDKLPDPTIGANFFGNPIETAAGSQRANLNVSQKIPWLGRLDALQQQAYFEAMALQQVYAAERLRVVGDVRAQYYRLYVLARQIETVEANQELLVVLIEIVNARVATGEATQGDVLLGTLELSRLEEQLITLRQQVISTESEINRLVNRSVNIPIVVPDKLDIPVPAWTHGMLVQTAFEQQPVIAAAQLRTDASRWGVEVAELQRRPDFQIGAAWFFTEGNRPPSSIVDVGRDAWSLGATVSIPLDREKYDAIRDEALWKHAATLSNVDDVRREFDSRLLDLLEQARAANDTANLYQDTIIPQSEQTLAADQESLTDGTVEFDRVIQDFRNLLTLEFGYHRSVGQLATAIARIRQAVGVDIQPQPEMPFVDPVPPAPEDDAVSPDENDTDSR